MTGAVYCTSQWRAIPLASATLARLTTLKLLFKVSATVTDYKVHPQTLFPALDYLRVYHVHSNYLK